MIPPRFERERLTGRVRARRGWFGRMVLQVEVVRESSTAWAHLRIGPPPGCRDLAAFARSEDERLRRVWREEKRQWRDAREVDLDAIAPRPSLAAVTT